MPNFRVTVEMIVSAKNEDAAQDEALAACRLADDMESLMSYDAKGAELVEDLDDVELSPRAHYRISATPDYEPPPRIWTVVRVDPRDFEKTGPVRWNLIDPNGKATDSFRTRAAAYQAQYAANLKASREEEIRDGLDAEGQIHPNL
jgi:hypothetical protein